MDSEKAKMVAGEYYDPTDPELVAEHRRTQALTNEYDATAPDASDERERVLSDLLGSVGDDVTVQPPFQCDYGFNTHVGDRFFANFDCVFLDVCRVEFGDDCMLGPGVHVYTATHPLNPEERAKGLEYGRPVTVGDDVWIGGRAVLNPGVSVGDGAMVASGAVVTEDVPERVVVQGNPATVVRSIE